LSIVVPAHNEATGIARAVQVILDALEKEYENGQHYLTLP